MQHDDDNYLSISCDLFYRILHLLCLLLRPIASLCRPHDRELGILEELRKQADLNALAPSRQSHRLHHQICRYLCARRKGSNKSHMAGLSIPDNKGTDGCLDPLSFPPCIPHPFYLSNLYTIFKN